MAMPEEDKLTKDEEDLVFDLLLADEDEEVTLAKIDALPERLRQFAHETCCIFLRVNIKTDTP